MLRTLLNFATLIGAVVALLGCEFSVSTDEGLNVKINKPKKETPENIAEFSDRVLVAVYEKDSDFLFENADPEIVDEFTPDFFTFIFQFIQETARPDLNVKKGSEYRPEDGLKDYLTLYHIPTGIGRDYLYVGLRGSEDNCCTISTLNINIKYGESYKMKEYKSKKKTNE